MIKSEFLLCVEGKIITRLKSINVNEAATNTYFAFSSLCLLIIV